MTKRIPLGNMCVHKIDMLFSQCCDEIEYIDISSVDNIKKKIVSSQIIPTVNAPSRAKQLINKGDVLVSTVRPNLNAVAIVDRETDNTLVASTGYCILRTENEIDQKYIYYFCQSPYFVEDMVKQATGASYPAVSSNIVKSSLIPDYGEYEKKKIVISLDKVSILIDERKKQLSKLDELVKSRFVELFSHNVDKVPMSSMCNVSGGYSFKSSDITENGNVKILQIGNVYLNDANWNTINYLPKGYEKTYSKFLLNENDIVIALTRPIIQSLGNVKACLVKNSDLPCLLNQRVGRIVPRDNTNICIKFIYGCLMTDDFTRYVESCCTGCSQPNISTKDLDNYMIPNATYEQQLEFVEFKEQIDKSKLEIKQSLEKFEILKKSLMQQYFG